MNRIEKEKEYVARYPARFRYEADIGTSPLMTHAAGHVSLGYRSMASAYHKGLLAFTPAFGHMGNVERGERVSGLPLDQSRETMLDAVMYLTIILSFGFPAVPWFFGARWGRRGVWLSTGLVIVILCLFTPLFFSACVASNCGQGAIAIFMLGPIWIVSALFTVTSAALAHYKFAR